MTLYRQERLVYNLEPMTVELSRLDNPENWNMSRPVILVHEGKNKTSGHVEKIAITFASIEHVVKGDLLLVFLSPEQADELRLKLQEL